MPALGRVARERDRERGREGEVFKLIGISNEAANEQQIAEGKPRQTRLLVAAAAALGGPILTQVQGDHAAFATCV